jgi:hypothetical protein
MALALVAVGVAGFLAEEPAGAVAGARRDDAVHDRAASDDARDAVAARDRRTRAAVRRAGGKAATR